MNTLSYNMSIQTRSTVPFTILSPCTVACSTNNGEMYGLRPTPPQYFPSQEPIDNNQNTIPRKLYVETYSKLQNNNNNNKKFIGWSNDSSSYTSKLKSLNVGKYSYKVGLPLDTAISTKSYGIPSDKTVLNRLRKHGSAAPPKKWYIYK